MDTIKECFTVIMQGNAEESRAAARRVRKVLYGSAVRDKEKFIEIKDVVSDSVRTSSLKSKI